MPRTPSLADVRRRATTRLAVGLLLVGALVLVPAAWVGLGGSAQATVSARTTPTGGSGGSSDVRTPSPSDPETDYGNGTGDPHANTDDEMTGGDLTPGRLAVIIVVVLVTAAIILTLTVRARRKRATGRGDLQ